MNLNHRMLVATLAATVALVLAAGCAGTPQEEWAKIPPRKELKVAPIELSHDVGFAAGDARLTTMERDRLRAFLARLDVASGDVLYLRPGPAEGAAAVRLAERRRAAIQAFLNALRIRPTGEPAGVDGAPPEGDAVRVVVRRFVVTLPGCPDWTGRPGWNFENTTSSNWGCATATNLGLMVDQPADLQAGRPGGPMDGAYGVLAIQNYQKGKTKPLLDDGRTSAVSPGAGSGSKTTEPKP